MSYIKDQPPPWWWDMIKILVIFYMLVSLVSCIHTPPARVKIHPDVKGNHDAIENEIRNAIEFIRIEESLDRRLWEQGLTIEVFQNNLGSCGEGCILLGLYWHYYNRIHVMWGNGTCTNMLFHELYHRVSYMKGFNDGMFGGSAAGKKHGIKFQTALNDPYEKWKLGRGCNELTETSE